MCDPTLLVANKKMSDDIKECGRNTVTWEEDGEGRERHIAPNLETKLRLWLKSFKIIDEILESFV
jgi:hypothetical protein